MKKFVDPIARVLIGGLFIFSGLIKLNDPVGTQIKMEEYFEVFAQDFGSLFHYFIPAALPIGLLLIVLEIVLGVAVLLFYRMRITMWVMLLLLVFFTFLTFYSAYFNKVTDCGCFGDAIKLTPWESFYKDVFLMVFVLHLFWYRGSYKSAVSERTGYSVTVATALISLFLGIYAIWHLPFIDFRAYRVGNNIPAQMQPAEQPIIEYVFEKAGQEVTSASFITDSTYRYKSSRVVNEDRVRPKITDYAVSDENGGDITQATFEGNKLLLVMYDITKTSVAHIDEIRELTKALDGQVDCLILTSSSAAQVDEFRHTHQLAVPFAFADATVLKTIIRSNPGLALWKNGTVLANWHHNDTPGKAEVLERLVQSTH